MTDKPPRRVTVTRPRTAVPAFPRVSTRTDLDEQTRVGVLLLASLRRAQLRLAVVIGSLLVVLLGGIPLLFLLDPRFGAHRIGGVPLGWLLLALFVYPVMCVGAWWFVRSAERREGDFTELVDRT